MTFHVPEKHRNGASFGSIKPGHPMFSLPEDGNNGVFFIPMRKKRNQKVAYVLQVIASDGNGWEHVSVSLPDRCPTWNEMCAVKNLFWDTDDCVVQYHPPESEYVNRHPYTLHLWRPLNINIPTPPKWMVG